MKIRRLNKKAQQSFSVFNIYVFMIVAFLAVVFFGGLIYVQGLIYDMLHDVGVQNENNALGVNFTSAADVTFGTVNNSIQALRLVALVIILCEGISIIITNALIKVHPLFFFVYVLICVLGVIFAAPISNAYYTLANSDIYGGDILPSFTGANYLLFNLPILVTIVGILGGVFLFINMVRQTNEVDQLR